MGSYFYTFKNHFDWEDYGRKIIICDIRIRYSEDNIHYIATMTINLNSNVICLIKGSINLQMPESDFRDVILKAADSWAKKQKQ